jgi:hypothetical protein
LPSSRADDGERADQERRVRRDHDTPRMSQRTVAVDQQEDAGEQHEAGYAAFPKNKGTGDINSASNFDCATS